MSRRQGAAGRSSKLMVDKLNALPITARLKHSKLTCLLLMPPVFLTVLQSSHTLQFCKRATFYLLYGSHFDCRARSGCESSKLIDVIAHLYRPASRRSPTHSVFRELARYAAPHPGRRNLSCRSVHRLPGRTLRASSSSGLASGQTIRPDCGQATDLGSPNPPR